MSQDKDLGNELFSVPGEPLDNARHERFAQLVATGMSNAAAYSGAGYDSEGAVASSAAGRLLKNVEVSERVEQWKQYHQDMAAYASKATMEQLQGMLMKEATTADASRDRQTAIDKLIKTMGGYQKDQDNRNEIPTKELVKQLRAKGFTDEMLALMGYDKIQ